MQQKKYNKIYDICALAIASQKELMKGLVTFPAVAKLLIRNWLAWNIVLKL